MRSRQSVAERVDDWRMMRGGRMAASLRSRLRTVMRGLSTALLTFAGAAALLAITAIVAAAIPSVRAVRVDPVTAFRSE